MCFLFAIPRPCAAIVEAALVVFRGATFRVKLLCARLMAPIFRVDSVYVLEIKSSTSGGRLTREFRVEGGLRDRLLN